LDVLSLIPPGVTYAQHREPSGTNTKSVFRRTPTEVVEWDDFLEKVASYTPSDIPMYKKKDFYFNESYRVSTESDLYSALDRNIYVVCKSRHHVNPVKGHQNFLLWSPK